MKNLLKNTIIITGAICIGLLLAYPIMHYSGNKNVRTLANSAIQEAVNADFYKREIAKRTGNSDNLPGKIKKVLRVVIKVLTNLKRFHRLVNSTLSI